MQHWWYVRHSRGSKEIDLATKKKAKKEARLNANRRTVLTTIRQYEAKSITPEYRNVVENHKLGLHAMVMERLQILYRMGNEAETEQHKQKGTARS
jgi:hypothetical protein